MWNWAEVRKASSLYGMLHPTLTPSCHFYRSSFRRKGSRPLCTRSLGPPWRREDAGCGAALSSMALLTSWGSGSRNWNLRWGCTVTLKTAPGDPLSPGRAQLNGLQPPKTTPPTGDQTYTQTHTRTKCIDTCRCTKTVWSRIQTHKDTDTLSVHTETQRHRPSVYTQTHTQRYHTQRDTQRCTYTDT